MHKSFTQETSQTKSFLILEQKLLCKSYKLTQLGLPTFLAPLLPRPPIQLASHNGVNSFLKEHSYFHKILYVLFMRNFFHLHNIAVSIFHEYLVKKATPSFVISVTSVQFPTPESKTQILIQLIQIFEPIAYCLYWQQFLICRYNVKWYHSLST